MDEIASRCTCFHLRRAARRTTQVYDRELAKVGLSLNEYSILRRAGEPKQLGVLAEALGMDRTTLTRNLKPMIEAGWIQERRSENDARQKLIVASAAGRRLLKRALPHWRNAQDRIEALFGAEQTLALHDDLARLDRALNEPGETA
ncbi:MAG: MarR family winged helix-turn-helix transcriptional regulator [Pseudoxanthomonas sp.]